MDSEQAASIAGSDGTVPNCERVHAKANVQVSNENARHAERIKSV